MITTINKDQVFALAKARIKEILGSSKGGKTTMSPDAVRQMNAVADTMKEITNYDSVAILDKDDLEHVNYFVDTFTADQVTGDIIDGVIQPMSEEIEIATMASLRENIDPNDVTMVLLVLALREAVVETGLWHAAPFQQA